MLLMWSEIGWLLVSTTDFVLLVFIATLPNGNVPLENLTGPAFAAEVVNPCQQGQSQD
jgi:hypothetical protein